MRLLYQPPGIIRYIFNHFLWQTNNNKVLLSFDDGPDPEVTELILIALKKHNVKALFFCVGENLERNISLTNDILNEGHTIGNHTYSHKILSKTSFNDTKSEINLLNNLMQKNHEYTVKYFRPPHGKFTLRTKKLMHATGMKCVMWSLLTYDYKNELKKVKFSIDNYLRKNSIIVLHDSIKSKEIIVSAIEYIVEKVNENNFEFGDPEECLN